MNSGGFSWKTFFGLTGAKRKASRAIGMPFTKGGRQRKAGAGNLMALLFTIFFDR